jgi:diguanylate cyclase (GGDEF)-like protein
MLIFSSGAAALLLFLLYLTSFISSTIAANRALYAYTFTTMAVIFVLSVCVFRKYPISILPVYYGFLTLVFAFSISLSGYRQANIPSTTFCVLLFVLPLLIIDKPYRMSLYLILAVCIFCRVSHIYKAPAIASLDTINALSFLFLTILVNLIVVRMKIRDQLCQYQIEQEKDTDSLTQLLTKSASERNIRAALSDNSKEAALLILDIDNFKQINDTLGHAFGDTIIHITGQCIRNSFRSTDILGRFGGDEFLIFMDGTQDKKLIENRLEYFHKQLKKDLIAFKDNVQIQISIGIALCPNTSHDYDELFQFADIALYKSKRNGKNLYTFYTQGE